MRKSISCVLMISLLLSGCANNTTASPAHLAAGIRAEYLAIERCSTTVDISADYGEQVFCFTVNSLWEREGDTVLTVVEPELLSGITARIRDGETILEYDGAGLSIGMLDLSGLTPVTCVPALMDCIMTGYMARCSWVGEEENRMLYVLCRDPEASEGQGTEFGLYFDTETHALKKAEVSVDGVLRVTAQFTEFLMELTEDETGKDKDLGRDRPGQSGT